MSKNKRGAKSSSAARPGPKGAPQRRNKLNPKSKSSAKPHIQASQQKPTIPFGAEDDILLIGEGTPFPPTFL